jgi:hypothetical protein
MSLRKFIKERAEKNRLKKIEYVSSVENLIIVTGADHTHAKSLFQFLDSVNKHEPDITAVVYDLGLSDDDRSRLTEDYPNFLLRKFEFDKYPKHFDITKNAGEYAWKPTIIHKVLLEFKRPVCWMDAGNLVVAPLQMLRKIIGFCGIYTPESLGIVKEWTHPKMLENFAVPRSFYKKRNRSGGCVGVDYNSKTALEIVEKWAACAMKKECIAPEGSNRENHRQDQASLTLLLHLYDIEKNIPENCYDFIFHQDID